MSNLYEIFSQLETEKLQYISEKIKYYRKHGYTKREAINRAHQSWRTFIGNKIQKILIQKLREELKRYDLKVTTDSVLAKKSLPKELEIVKRYLAINYGKYLFLPDADIIVYKICHDEPVIIAILSVKNSFRERGFETTYWKLKIKQSEITSHIKVLLVTPDKDNEISYIQPQNRSKKCVLY